MICPHCKNRIHLKNDNKYCPYCGRNAYELPDDPIDDPIDDPKPSLAMIGAIAICGIVLLGTTLTGAYMVAQHKLRAGTEIAVDDSDSGNSNDNGSGVITVNGVTATTEKEDREEVNQPVLPPSTRAQEEPTSYQPPVTPPATTQKPAETTPEATEKKPATPKASSESKGSTTTTPSATTKKKKNTKKTNESSVKETAEEPANTPSNPDNGIVEGAGPVVAVYVDPVAGPKEEDDETIIPENEEPDVVDELMGYVEQEIKGKGYQIIYIDPESVNEEDEVTEEEGPYTIPEEADFVVSITLYNDSETLDECSYEIECYSAKDDQALEGECTEIADSVSKMLTENHGMEQIVIDESEEATTEE